MGKQSPNRQKQKMKKQRWMRRSRKEQRDVKKIAVQQRRQRRLMKPVPPSRRSLQSEGLIWVGRNSEQARQT
jgi:hypothetical protein